MLQPGMTLQQRYRIRSVLGRGGFATVYLADDVRLGQRQVAIKEFTVNLLPQRSREWAKKSFRQEAMLLANLSHPAIAQVSDFFSAGQFDYLVMEYVPGRTLNEVVDQVPGRRLDERQVRQWAQELCDVLHHLHSQTPPLIFRDLKPSNIIIRPDGQLKLIDFGIVRYFKPGKQSDTQVVGTPGYAAPEQYGHGQTDARSDVYSMGVLLHELLTGHDPGSTPLNLPDPSLLNPAISPQVAAVIKQATQVNHLLRFANMGAFAQALGMPIGGGSLGPTTPADPLTPWSLPGHTPADLPTPPVLAQQGVPGWLMVIVAVSVVIFLCVVGLFVGMSLWGDRFDLGTVVAGGVMSSTPGLTATLTPPSTTSPVPPLDVPDLPTDTPTSTPSPTPSPTPTSTPTIMPTVPTSTPSRTPTPAPDGFVVGAVNGAIVFDSTRDNGAAEIYIMDSQGADPRRLTFNISVQHDEPDLSPDGQLIAYEARLGAAWMVYTMDTNGNNVRAVVEGRLPDWSPDGGRLAYESETQPRQIWMVDYPNGVPRQLTQNSRANRAASWSPDGREIVYMSEVNGIWQIFIMDVATRVERQVTTGSESRRYPVWSPDGGLIAYNTIVGDGNPEEVWVMEPDGSNVRAVTSGGLNGRPAWSPDGQFLLFNTWRDARWLIYRVGRDGSDPTRLTVQGQDSRPDWGSP